MSLRHGVRRGRTLLGIAPAIAMVASCASWGELSGPAGVALAGPPPAVAPPDAGVEPPQVQLLAPRSGPLSIEDRPQGQLAAWSESMADELNIPRAALQAYGYAARFLEVAEPECGLTWTLLAGIGTVESSHGRYGGATLDMTGRPSSEIRGLPLDGSEGVQRIEDTDQGRLDGDEAFDRAVGPLQFIPGTWARWAADADGDGVADPDDIDDAALAAGNYLCEEAGDLRRPEGFWKAMLAYNASAEYVQDVLDHADHYGRTSRTLPVEW